MEKTKIVLKFDFWYFFCFFLIEICISSSKLLNYQQKNKSVLNTCEIYHSFSSLWLPSFFINREKKKCNIVRLPFGCSSSTLFARKKPLSNNMSYCCLQSKNYILQKATFFKESVAVSYKLKTEKRFPFHFFSSVLPIYRKNKYIFFFNICKQPSKKYINILLNHCYDYEVKQCVVCHKKAEKKNDIAFSLCNYKAFQSFLDSILQNKSEIKLHQCISEILSNNHKCKKKSLLFASTKEEEFKHEETNDFSFIRPPRNLYFKFLKEKKGGKLNLDSSQSVTAKDYKQCILNNTDLLLSQQTPISVENIMSEDCSYNGPPKNLVNFSSNDRFFGDVDVNPQYAQTDLAEYDLDYSGLGPWPSYELLMRFNLTTNKTENDVFFEAAARDIKTVAEAMKEKERWEKRFASSSQDWLLEADELSLLSKEERKRYMNHIKIWLTFYKNPRLKELHNKANPYHDSYLPKFRLLEDSYTYVAPSKPINIELDHFDDPLDCEWRKTAEKAIIEVVENGWPSEEKEKTIYEVYDITWSLQKVDVIVKKKENIDYEILAENSPIFANNFEVNNKINNSTKHHFTVFELKNLANSIEKRLAWLCIEDDIDILSWHELFISSFGGLNNLNSRRAWNANIGSKVIVKLVDSVEMHAIMLGSTDFFFLKVQDFDSRQVIFLPIVEILSVMLKEPKCNEKDKSMELEVLSYQKNVTNDGINKENYEIYEITEEKSIKEKKLRNNDYSFELSSFKETKEQENAVELGEQYLKQNEDENNYDDFENDNFKNSDTSYTENY